MNERPYWEHFLYLEARAHRVMRRRRHTRVALGVLALAAAVVLVVSSLV